MAFAYFAYGSNLWPGRMVDRCPSAVAIATATLDGWRVRFSKPGKDGTAKLDITETADSVVWGAVYAVQDRHRAALDAAEPGYHAIEVSVLTDAGPLDALTYRWPGAVTGVEPAAWYRDLAVAGARHHGLPEDYVGSALGS